MLPKAYKESIESDHLDRPLLHLAIEGIPQVVKVVLILMAMVLFHFLVFHWSVKEVVVEAVHLIDESDERMVTFDNRRVLIQKSSPAFGLLLDRGDKVKFGNYDDEYELYADHKILSATVAAVSDASGKLDVQVLIGSTQVQIRTPRTCSASDFTIGDTIKVIAIPNVNQGYSYTHYFTRVPNSPFF